MIDEVQPTRPIFRNGPPNDDFFGSAKRTRQLDDALMFESLKGTWQQLQMMQRLMKDERFKAFITHPKVQALLSDQAFQAAVKSKDTVRITTALAPLSRDPELAPLVAQINFQTLLKP